MKRRRSSRLGQLLNRKVLSASERCAQTVEKTHPLLRTLAGRNLLTARYRVRGTGVLTRCGAGTVDEVPESQVLMADPQLGSDAPIREFLTALASADAAQSAVSAAAVAGAMGTSLLLLVAALPTTRSDSVDERTALMEAGAALGDVQQQLIETIETETVVKLLAARNMPQASQAQRSKRQAAIQLALRAAADVPLEVIRLCALGLRHAQTVATSSCRAAASEVDLAIALLRVGLTGARSNLETRLSSLTDVVYTKAVVEEIARLSEEAMAAARAAELSVQAPPA
jgi:methenyltetrahydrofolate cyclohydrolase